jgi:4-amino-4-deoxy-L-arabinose transferase-like glycosyltransferase
MKQTREWRSALTGGLGILLLLAVARLLFHALTNGQYGFHRDELALLDNARHLDWGFVDYPPLTAASVRVAFELFGASLVGLRLTSVLAMCIAMVLSGLIAREMGASRWAQVVTAVAVAIAPQQLAMSARFDYTAIDFLWWVWIAYCMVRLLKSEDPRWWLGVGAGVGLGMLTKYTMAFYVAGIVVGVLVTPARRYLRSRWLWAGVALSIVIVLPNLIWQARHGFIALDFLRSIHARDVRIGRTAAFLPEQLYSNVNLFTLPLWLAGLYFYFRAEAGARYRALGWMYVVPLALLLLANSRSHYLSPAYPMLLAGGAVWLDGWLTRQSARRARIVRAGTWVSLAVGALAFSWLVLPITPVGSRPFDLANEVHDSFREQIGWPELVNAVAGVYNGLPAGERPRAGIIARNYGEAGAISLYGPALGLPEPISPTNTYWLRGYGDPPPEPLIVVGVDLAAANEAFESCQVAADYAMPYDLKNEESEKTKLLLCRRPRLPWAEFWQRYREFG